MKSILDAVATIDERFELLSFLDHMAEIIYMPDFDVKKIIDRAPLSASGIISEIFSIPLSQSQESVARTLERVRSELENMPIVSLTIAIKPTKDLFWMIKNWFLNKNGQNILVDLSMDKSLVGGAIVESNGFRSEYSFKKYFESRKDKN